MENITWKTGHKCQDNIKICEELWNEGVSWFHLSQNREQLWALVTIVTIRVVP
jgi:hypothetical protein